MAISDLSEEQFKTYAKESKNWKEFMIKCGYTNLGCKQYITPFHISNAEFFINNNKIDLILLSLLYFIH